jgi:hypothetical protein
MRLATTFRQGVKTCGMNVSILVLHTRHADVMDEFEEQVEEFQRMSAYSLFDLYLAPLQVYS